MKDVTYESGARLRIGILRGGQVFGSDFDGDMVAFISDSARWVQGLFVTFSPSRDI
jgi:hypothetical protein